MGAPIEVKLAMAVVALIAFGVVFWWRRRNPVSGLDLSESSQQLKEMEKGSDTPEAEDVAEGIARVFKSMFLR